MEAEFNLNEIKAIATAVQSMVDDIKAVKNKPIPFTPQARKDMSDMLEAGTSVLRKLKNVTGISIHPTAPLTADDYKDIFTKDS